MIRRVLGANPCRFPLGHGRAGPGHHDHVGTVPTPTLPFPACGGGQGGGRDEPCDDAMSFPPLLRLFISLLHMGDEAPSLIVVHSCHETTCLTDDVIFYLIFLWSASAFRRSLFRQNEILMVPLRIASDVVPCNTNFVP